MHKGETTTPDWNRLRSRMVEEQLTGRGLKSRKVLDAMMNVPREQFVPGTVRSRAYEDRALPIDYGQTISQPYIVAFMTETLELFPDANLLEVGTGSGYQTAVLAMMAAHVNSIERIPELAQRAETTLQSLGIRNVTLTVGDGSTGLPERAPFDRIIVTAASPKVPGPLFDQLKDDGVLVLPRGGMDEQEIVRIKRKSGRCIEERLIPCRFVKLVGANAWPAGRTTDEPRK